MPGRDDHGPPLAHPDAVRRAAGRRPGRCGRTVPTRLVDVDDCRIAATALARELLAGGDPHQAPVEEIVETSAGSATFQVEADGFWQVHPEAPRVLVETVIDLLDPAPGERALDLYAGVGLFARFLSEAVGETTRVVAVEADRAASKHARGNLARPDQASWPPAVTVDRVSATSYDEPFDLVVLDPPREGAARKVVEQIVDRRPRAVAYVACDPAALAAMSRLRRARLRS